MAGEALVDLIVRPDGEIVSVAGGSPYNSVRAIARLGVAASWVGGLSSDRFGRMLEDGLAGDGVGRELVQRTDLPTTLALAELGADGSASYRFYTEATSAPNVLPGPLAGGIPASARAFLTGSLGLVLEPMASTLEAIASAVPRDRIVMLDPNARPSITRDPDAWRARMERIMARADIVKASTEDLEYLRPGETPEAAAAWVRAHGPTVVLVTDGSRPVRVLAGDAIELVPAPPGHGRRHRRGGGHLRRCLPRLSRARGDRAGRPGRRGHGPAGRAFRGAGVRVRVRAGRRQPADAGRARGLAGRLTRLRCIPGMPDAIRGCSACLMAL